MKMTPINLTPSPDLSGLSAAELLAVIAGFQQQLALKTKLFNPKKRLSSGVTPISCYSKSCCVCAGSSALPPAARNSISSRSLMRQSWKRTSTPCWPSYPMTCRKLPKQRPSRANVASPPHCCASASNSPSAMSRKPGPARCSLPRSKRSCSSFRLNSRCWRSGKRRRCSSVMAKR